MSVSTGGSQGGSPRSAGCCPSPSGWHPPRGNAELAGAGGWFGLCRGDASTPWVFLALPGKVAGLSGSQFTSLTAERMQKTSGQRKQFLHAGELKMRSNVFQAYCSVWTSRTKSFGIFFFFCVKRHKATLILGSASKDMSRI